MSYIGVQPTAGQYRQLDDISGSFNGATVTFTTSVGGLNVTAGSAEQLLVSLGGVIQNPGADYSVSTNSITFTTAPGSGLDFFAILMGDAVNVGTPADGSVTSVKLASDLTVDLASGTVSAPSLTFDANTGLYSPGADQVAVATNGVERVEFGTSEVVFNDGGEDIDFRIEGDTNSSLFFVDAGNDRVGIGTTSVDELLHVEGAASGGTIAAKIQNNVGAADSDAALKLTTNSDTWQITSKYTGGALAISNGVGEKARLDSSGRLLVGTSSDITGGTNYLIQSISSTGAFIALGRDDGTVANGDGIGGIQFYGNDGGSYEGAAFIGAFADGTHSAGSKPSRLIFSTTNAGDPSPTERMRIAANGQVTITNDVPGWSHNVVNDGNDVSRYGIKVQCGRDDSTGTNYAMTFNDGNDTNQGYITFSGGTVTYGNFTAYHPCILPDVDNESGYPYGTLLEITSLEYTQKDSQDTERGILYNVRKTQAANSRAILGAYGSSMNGGPDGAINRHQALVLGDGHILCNNSGGNIKAGDGICSSAAPGIGQKAIATPSMIIGIAQEDITFDGDEVKLVPVQYGLQQFIPWQD